MHVASQSKSFDPMVFENDTLGLQRGDYPCALIAHSPGYAGGLIGSRKTGRVNDYPGAAAQIRHTFNDRPAAHQSILLRTATAP
ncbi:hypothetical protein IP91_00662 [Pseudoduganella lurida]|uniref:Uncharacterized protein n=1 Tax=Pseudoduganella lurida TaxID=1036180 RepID=A0A562RKL9_9BURK|nr:hypothetical protein IP91_00662 [Pseudoduganella lurida]